MENEMKTYKCRSCGEVFEAITYKSDNQSACPFCFKGIGYEVKENEKEVK